MAELAPDQFHSQRVCGRCSVTFVGGHRAKLCPKCKPVSLKGVGSGGNQWGEKNHRWKGGWMSGLLRRQIIEDANKCCELCSTDLSKHIGINYSGRNGWWGIDHIDGNRRNNVRENLRLLCKRCHQLKHDCARVFGATASAVRWERSRVNKV